MVTTTENKNNIPSLDFEKELNRWNEVLNVMNKPKPKIYPTPKQKVWKKNKATLYYYPPEEKKYEVPIFLIFSLLNRPYILDFAPGASVVEGLVKLGYEVYLLDWGIQGYEDKEMNLEDYIDDFIKKGVQRALRHSSANEITLLGYCLGGVLASIYAAIAEEPIKNLIVATVPIDWSVNTLPDKWLEGLKQGTLNMDRWIDVYGILPAWLVYGLFQAFNSPINNSPYVNLLARADDKRFVKSWSRINNWMNDQVPFAGETFRQIMNDIIIENKVIKGEFSVRGKKVDLKNIKSNLLAISSKNDNLVLEEQSRPIMDLVSSEDKTFQKVEAGHINLALTGKLAGIADQWLKERS
ncbi:alpha/beta fold hydrolase [Gottfriedia sp. NPDC056225]|uniref:alpha/beta fold hydrolase n=1 Tax=Gottfriedia sp. NPDC056225 TaxID=3345751 RepID=UPI001C205D0C